jgi:hypothetical protein
MVTESGAAANAAEAAKTTMTIADTTFFILLPPWDKLKQSNYILMVGFCQVPD